MASYSRCCLWVLLVVMGHPVLHGVFSLFVSSIQLNTMSSIQLSLVHCQEQLGTHRNSSAHCAVLGVTHFSYTVKEIIIVRFFNIRTQKKKKKLLASWSEILDLHQIIPCPWTVPGFVYCSFDQPKGEIFDHLMKGFCAGKDMEKW